MIGFKSSNPTFFVGESKTGPTSTGRIGIGNVTAPQAKLHIREDESYDTASVYIQGYSETRPAYLWLGTKNYGLHKHSASLQFLTGDYYEFNEGNVGIGVSEPREKLEVDGNLKVMDRYHLETTQVRSNSREGLKLLARTGSGISVNEYGQVGIGNTSPGATLDVSGKIKTRSLQIPDPAPDNPELITGSVLQSADQYGNVRWVPQESLDDGDWHLAEETTDIYFTDGYVGIGLDQPGTMLDVAGDITGHTLNVTGLQLNDGNQAAGRFLRSDANGSATWVDPPETGDDDWEMSGLDIFRTSGHVGIGADTPQAKLHVKNQSLAYSVKIESSNKGIYFGRMVYNADQVYGTSYLGLGIYRNGENEWNTEVDYMTNGGALIYGTISGSIGFVTVPSSGSGAPLALNDQEIRDNTHMMLNTAGLLKVNEVLVKANIWSDYVFHDDYSLPDLNELEKFINANRHLPDVPPEDRVKEEGINLGEMDALLLKKIEELTLYVIDLKKENEAMRQRIDELEK